MKGSSALRTIGLAGLVVGFLDITSAFVIANIRGMGSMRMLQGITSGLIGAQSFKGGFATAAYGLAIHFLIAFAVVTVFYLASRQMVFLTEHAIVSGILYGIAVYLFMYWIVIRVVFPNAHPSLTRDVTAILVHISLIGLPTALIVQRFSKQ